MKLIPYKEALKMGKDALKEALVPIRVNRARKQAELEMCKLDEEIANLQAALHEQCALENVNFNKIIDMQDDLRLVERKREQYEQILVEMFPEDG